MRPNCPCETDFCAIHMPILCSRNSLDKDTRVKSNTPGETTFRARYNLSGESLHGASYKSSVLDSPLFDLTTTLTLHLATSHSSLTTDHLALPHRLPLQIHHLSSTDSLYQHEHASTYFCGSRLHQAITSDGEHPPQSPRRAPKQNFRSCLP